MSTSILQVSGHSQLLAVIKHQIRKHQVSRDTFICQAVSIQAVSVSSSDRTPVTLSGVITVLSGSVSFSLARSKALPVSRSLPDLPLYLGRK